jgi:hypothetical protein
VERERRRLTRTECPSTTLCTPPKAANYTHAAEVRSLISRQFGVPKITTLRISAKPNPSGKYIHVTMHHVNVNVPLFILFRVV